MLEYKHYLQSQFMKIEARILGDESIHIFKDLENKEFMNRRVNEIFEKTYVSERENYIKNLLNENNNLKELVQSLGAPVPTSIPTSLQPVPSYPPTSRYEQIQTSKLIRQNQDLKGRLMETQSFFQKEKEGFRKQVLQLQQRVRAGEGRVSAQSEEWKQKEAKFMESFKEFIEENKNLQTEVMDLRARLDGQKLKQTATNNDSDNTRRRVKQLELENQEIIGNLNNSLNQLKMITHANSKLTKDYSFLEHKYKLLEDQKTRLQQEIEGLGDVRSLEMDENYRMMEMECGVKESLISKMRANISCLGKELEEKSAEVIIWKENYESSLKSNNVEKVKLKYQYEILELQNQINSNLQDYQRELQKRSQRANNIMKGEIMSIQSMKVKEKGDYNQRINLLNKEKYQLQERVRGLEREMEEIDTDSRRGRLEIEKEVDRLVLENETMKSSLGYKESQYKKNVRNLEEQVESLRRGVSEKGDEINQLEVEMVKMRRENKEMRSEWEKEKERTKSGELLMAKKEFAMKDLEKMIDAKENKCKEILSAMAIETQQKNQLKLMLVEQKNETNKLSSELNKQKVLLSKNQSLNNQIQLKNRTQIKEMADRYQQQILRVKSEITLQVHQQMRAMDQLTMTEKGKAQIAYKYQKQELERLYKENNDLKQRHALDQIHIRQLSDNLKEVQNDIALIRQNQLSGSLESKHQIDLLKQENTHILQSLLIAKSQNTEYKSKIGEFKLQTNLIIKGVLKMFWEEILSIKQQFVLFQKQQKHSIDAYRIELGERVKQYANTCNAKLREAYQQDCEGLKSKYNSELNTNQEEWEQRCRKLELDLMALDAQRQMERSENNKRLKTKQSEIEHEQENYDQLLKKNSELESLCAKYPPIIKKLQQKNKQLVDLIEVHKYQQSKYKTKYEREQEKGKRLQNQYESKMESHKSKYIQDNEELFNRYQKSLQDMITKTTISDVNLEDTVSFKTPKTRASISNLRQQISQQQNRLRQFGKY